MLGTGFSVTVAPIRNGPHAARGLFAAGHPAGGEGPPGGRGGSGRGDGPNAVRERRIDLGCERWSRVAAPSQRTAALAAEFGLPLFDTPTVVIRSRLIRLAPGRIVLIVGPSGSGKSSALAQVERQCPGGCRVERVAFPADAAIVDGVAPWADLPEAVGLLTACGLGDAHVWVRRFDCLSDGEKFRARLAHAVARQSRGDAAGPLLCDEFCSSLHRRVVCAIGFGLRKLAWRRRLAMVLAWNREDAVGDLQPDVIVRLRDGGRCEVDDRGPRQRRPFSLRRRLVIEPGRKADYDAMAAMHYRATGELGFVDKVFVLREARGGVEPLGIVVYSHAPLELRLRNQATKKRFSRRPDRVNGELRILRRLIIHPDVRGCGLGHYLVRRTLPRVGTPYVECLASMGEFNPVFERAGMTRIGRYGLPSLQRSALAALHEKGVDPSGREFPVHVARRPDVRTVVARVVFEWYRRTTGGGARRVERQSARTLAQTFRGLIACRPVYYLWKRRSSP